MLRYFWLLIFAFGNLLQAQNLAVLRYNGGGDWYANPTALPNLIKFCKSAGLVNLNAPIAQVSLLNDDIFNHPFVHMTGHGNVVFSQEEIQRLRLYLEAGGFLHIDDNYGMDPYIRPILQKLFSDSPLEQLSIKHAIFKKPFLFEKGLPKIHEHDGKAPEAWGIWRNGRLVLLYTYESDLSDGWEDQEIHNDPEEIRQLALQMGANILVFAFTSSKDDRP